MTLRCITARLECDGCGSEFRTVLDPAQEINGASLMSVVEEAVKDDLSTSVQQGLHLCDRCTKIADNIGEEDHQPTRDEILEACRKKTPASADTPRPSIYHTQSLAWQRGYDWARDIGPHSDELYAEAQESWGYEPYGASQESRDFDLGSNYVFAAEEQ